MTNNIDFYKTELINRDLIESLIGRANAYTSDSTLKKLLHQHITEQPNTFAVVYRIPVCGRIFPRTNQISLGSLPKELRGYLAKPNYIDIDMKSCHPTILKNLLKKNNINTTTLDEYLNDKVKFLEEENCDKDKFLKVINTEKIDHLKMSDKINTFHKTIYEGFVPILKAKAKEDIIIKECLKKAKSSTERKRQQKQHGFPNDNGSFIANYLQHIERDILLAQIDFFENNPDYNVKIDVLIHDGFLVRKNDQMIIDDVLKKCADIVHEKFDYEGVEYVKKEFVEGFSPEDTMKIDKKDRHPIFLDIVRRYTQKHELAKIKKDNKVTIYKKTQPFWYEEITASGKNDAYTMSDLINDVFEDHQYKSLYEDDVKFHRDLVTFFEKTRNIATFPELKVSKDFIVYQNGLHDLHNNKLIKYKDAPEDLMCAKNFIDEQFSFKHDTPNWDHLLDSQFKDARVKKFFNAFVVGRNFFNIGEYDNWQIAPYLQGAAASGKSTLIKCVEKMHGFDNVGAVTPNDQTFGLASTAGKDIVVFHEFDSNDHPNPQNFLSMISGEAVMIRKMHSIGKRDSEWKAPIIFLSNKLPGWTDNDGAIKRRLLFFQFNPVKNRDGKIGQRILKERPAIIQKSIKDYFDLIEEFGSSGNIQENLPEQLKEDSDEYNNQSNPLGYFLDLGSVESSGKVYSIEYEKDALTLFSDFQKAFVNWMKWPSNKNRFSNPDTKITSTNYNFIERGFESKKINVCKHCQKIPGKGECCDKYNRIDRIKRVFLCNMKYSVSRKIENEYNPSDYIDDEEEEEEVEEVEPGFFDS